MTAEHQKALAVSLSMPRSNNGVHIPQEVQKFITQLEQKHKLETIVKTEEYKRKYLHLSHRLLQVSHPHFRNHLLEKVAKKIEVLQNKGYSLFPDEEALRAKLESLQRELDNPTQFKGTLREITSMIR